MMKKILLLVFMSWAALAQADVSLQECQDAARANYPSLRQFKLIDETAGMTIENIKKTLLPQISVSGQATWQSDVAKYPQALENMLSQMGTNMKGLSKDQYKFSLDVSQTIWDGGQSRTLTQQTRAKQKVESAQLEVELYALRKRINDLYFGILLLEAHRLQTEYAITLLQTNRASLASALKNGTAMKSELCAIDAEILVSLQRKESVESDVANLRNVLSLFTGLKKLSGENLILPKLCTEFCTAEQRPEMKLLKAKIDELQFQRQEVKVSLMPKFSAFAQGFYGKPGLNMFDDMMNNKLSWNYIVGIKATWSIGGLYTSKNKMKILERRAESYDAQRETFLFNSSLSTMQRKGEMEQKKKIMSKDEEIVKLRMEIRKASESKLANGIISVNDLIQDITKEADAQLAMKIHEIEMVEKSQDISNINNQ